MNIYDVLVIGGGAAGLSASLVLARARRRVLVVDSGAPRNAPAAHMQGFLSRDGMPPGELLAAGRDGGGRLRRHAPDRHRHELSSTVARRGSRRLLEDGQRVKARKVLVTTGLHDELPDVPGPRRTVGQGRAALPVLPRLGGAGPAARGPVERPGQRPLRPDRAAVDPRRGPVRPAGHADRPRPRPSWSPEPSASSKAPSTSVVVENDSLTGSRWSTAAASPARRCSSRPASSRTTTCSPALGVRPGRAGVGGHRTQRRHQRPGVWVAGNVTNPRAQVITAAGEGSAAAIAINADLVGDDVRAAVEHVQPGFTCPLASTPITSPPPPTPRSTTMSNTTANRL